MRMMKFGLDCRICDWMHYIFDEKGKYFMHKFNSDNRYETHVKFCNMVCQATPCPGLRENNDVIWRNGAVYRPFVVIWVEVMNCDNFTKFSSKRSFRPVSIKVHNARLQINGYSNFQFAFCQFNLVLVNISGILQVQRMRMKVVGAENYIPLIWVATP